MKTFDKYFSCTRKTRYGHKETAQKAARVMAEKRGVRGLQTYKCRHCDGWHIGHAPLRFVCR